MLLQTLVCLTLALAQTGDPQRVEVVGPVELTPAAAVASARVAAADQFAWELERRGRAVAERARPLWVPGFMADAWLRRWLRTVRPEGGLSVVGQETRRHDHGDYVSFQTALSVAQDDSWTTGALAQLRRAIENGSQRLVVLLGGTVGLWGLLGLLYAWFDRVSRGYMSWRLRALFGGMGLVLPGIALLLV